MIEVKNISKSYDGKVIFENLTFSIKDREHCVFMGTSGAGKTTLLRILADLEQPDSGEIILPKDIKKTFVFQENRLFGNATVLDNILAVSPDMNRAEYFINACLLGDDINKKAKTLSGGMKRRLEIARALTFGGDIYFFDEPLRELDSKTSEVITELIKKETEGKTSVLITHDSSCAGILADRIITFDGSPMKIISDSENKK